MKKSIAVAATLVMAAALSVSAYAADHSTAGVPDVNITVTHAGEDETFKQGSYVKKPTCTEPGVWRYACTEDEKAFHEVDVPALEHEWSSDVDGKEWGKVVEQPTCQEEGLAVDFCTRCGEENYDNTRTVPKLAHQFKEEAIEGSFKKATCISKGEQKFQNVCSECGEIELDKNGKPIVRTETWNWTNPEKEDEKNVPHNWDEWVHEKEATCSTEGTDIRWCKTCGKKVQKTVPVLKPEWIQDKVKRINCYETEVTYKCANCDGKKNPDHASYTEIKEDKKHVFSDKADQKLSVKPTCTTWGYDVYPCKDVATGDSAKHSHSDKVKTETRVYKDRGKNYRTTITYLDGYDYEPIAPTPHAWGEWKQRSVSGDSTYWLRTCKNCSATDEQITKNGETPVEPQYTEDGLTYVESTKTWELYKDGQLQSDFTGITKYDGGEFFINKGVLDEKANGLTLVDGTWYFLSKGQVQRGYDGPALYDKNWFMIKNGELNEDANGLYPYDGGTFLFAAGKLRRDVSGLWQDAYGTNGDAGKWYFLAEGQVVDFTGVAEYNGSFFVVEKGVFNNSYNGTIEYDGATFNVVNGQLYDQVAKEAA